jgi:GNAT superfamily N-acetyltransferase
VIVVRAAEPADIDDIVEVHIATWKVAYRGQLPDDYLDGLDATRSRRVPIWQQAIGDPAKRVVVAESDGEIVGFVSVGRSDEPLPAGCGELFAIYVHPKAWDAGVGRALMIRALDELRFLGYSNAILWVLESNARARTFYERGGWRADGTTKTETRPGVVLSEVRYARSLGA